MNKMKHINEHKVILKQPKEEEKLLPIPIKVCLITIKRNLLNTCSILACCSI